MLAWEQGQYLRKYDAKLALRGLSMLFILGSLSLKKAQAKAPSNPTQ
jgi:hypothetical protein